MLTSTALAEDEVIGTEELAEGTSTDGIHGTRLEIDENGTRDILVASSLSCGQDNAFSQYFGAAYLIEVDVHALELKVGGAIVANTGQYTCY